METPDASRTDVLRRGTSSGLRDSHVLYTYDAHVYMQGRHSNI